MNAFIYNTDNVFKTKEYSEYRRRFSWCFDSKYFTEETHKELTSDYSISIKKYVAEVKSGISDINTLYTCAEAVVFDSCGDEIYSYKITYDHDFSPKVIDHSNGNRYLFFKTELYGYSVLDLATREEFHYVPSCSFVDSSSYKATELRETFIIAGDVIYNPKNDILITNGCYWAAPYELLILDFSKPMQMGRHVDCFSLLDEEVWDDDVVFKAWLGDDLQVTSCVNGDITIARSEYAKWLYDVDIADI